MKKCYNKGIKSLTEAEKYIYGLIQKDISISEEIGKEINIMKEFTKEIQEVMKEENFGESYDKEWALKDLGRLEGIKEGKIKGIEEVAKNLIKSGFDIETVSKNTNLSIKEVEELKSSI
jgi:predicted transposase/invertase (TIGR01784 family)